MLRIAHRQVLAARMADLLASSPLVIIYQALGNAETPALNTALQTQLQQALPDRKDIQATCIRMPNDITAQSDNETLRRYMCASNLLVGWRVADASILPAIRSFQGTQLEDIATWTAEKQASGIASLSVKKKPLTRVQMWAQPKRPPILRAQPSPPKTPPLSAKSPRLPHKVLAPLIQHSLELAAKHPVTPIAAFYRGQQVRLKDLKRWAQLDELTVMAELIGQLESVGQELVEAQAVGDTLTQTLDLMQPDELLYVLDQRGMGQGQDTGTAAQAQGAAAT